MEEYAELIGLVQEHVGFVAVGALAFGFLVWTGFQTFMSRIKPTDLSKDHFLHPGLLTMPNRGFGYSNRFAYLMAELSYLAYFEFEKSKSIVKNAVLKLLAEKESLDAKTAEALVKKIMTDTVTHGGVGVLRDILSKHQFELLETINQGSLQGYVAKNVRPETAPFLAIAFRGSEKKVNDWLTNFKAVPRKFDDGRKVHTGFFDSFDKVRPELDGYIAKHGTDENGNQLPVYFTGHSLGGAWALLAASLVTPTHLGACYSFGAPRIANYDFFFSVKRPVFRVVNSADIVPRVPPGVVSKIVFGVCLGLAKLIPIPIVSSLFEKTARFFNRLKDYRHFGDQRYLTDVRNGRFEDTVLLQNPHIADRLLWFWKSMLAGIAFPIKSHSMTIYRDKLAAIAARKARSG